jgi:hypothetical protein
MGEGAAQQFVVASFFFFQLIIIIIKRKERKVGEWGSVQLPLFFVFISFIIIINK